MYGLVLSTGLLLAEQMVNYVSIFYHRMAYRCVGSGQAVGDMYYLRSLELSD
jgi:hypothetical protein